MVRCSAVVVFLLSLLCGISQDLPEQLLASIRPLGSSYSGTPDILWWQFNTGSGSTETATVGPNGTLHNSPTWSTTFTPGGSTSDLLFPDSCFCYVDSASGVTFGSGIITIELRIYATNYGNTLAYQPWAQVEDTAGGGTNYCKIGNALDSGSGAVELFIVDKGINSGTFTIPRPAVSNWYHLAVVFDDSAKVTPVAYTNGVATTVTVVADNRSSFGGPFQTAAVFSINHIGTGPRIYVKDYRIFSGARSSANLLQDATNYP